MHGEQEMRMRRAPATGTIVLLLAAAAALQRAAFVGATRGDIVFSVPALDGAFYHVWARSLAEGRGDFQGPYFLGPLYPHLLALLYRLAGPDPWNVRLFQSALGVLDVALVTWIGCRAFGRITGAAAGALVAGYGPLAFHEGVLALDVPFVLLTLGALAAVRHGERTGSRGALACGVLVGLATLARPTAALLLPAAAWALGARRARVVTACLLAWIAIVTPVVVRNIRSGGGPAITTNGGVNFWAGNNAAARGRFHAPPGVQFFTSPVFAAAAGDASLPPAVAARALTVRAVAGTDDAARSGAWTRAALAWMVRHPGDASILWARKAWLLLQAREVAQIESYEFHAERLRMRAAFPIDFGWLWPLAALGAWRARRDRRRDAGVITAFAAALLLPCLVFFVTARYRMAALPEVALLAGLGAATLVEWVRRRDTRDLARGAAALAAIAIAARVGGQPPRGAAGWEHAQMAERLYAAGDHAAAIREQELAASLLPDRPEVQINLALYWHERAGAGDRDRAAALLRRTCDRWPGDATCRYNLGVVLDAAGDRDGALAAWRRALELDPRFEPARSRLLEADASSGP
jgi:4-amino-4-deoxy-L-arabinose transferase-like glycosyltransferase